MRFLKENKVVLGLMLLFISLTIPFISSFPIALDEPFTIFNAQKDLTDLWSIFVTENNPPLHFILLHFWIKVFGISDVAVRSLSVLFGLLTIPVLYKLSRRFMALWPSILVILIFIFSNFFHYHSLEARGYSLLVFLYTFALLCVYKFLFEPSLKSIIGLTIVNILILYTHYIGVFIISSQLLIFVLYFKRLSFQQIKRLAFGYVCCLVGFLPGLWLLLTRVIAVSEQGSWVPMPEFTELYGNLIRMLNEKFAVLGVVLISGLIISFILIKHKLEIKKLFNPFSSFLLANFIIPYMGMFLFSFLFEPVFLDRYLLFTFVPFIVLSAYLLHELTKPYIKQWILIIVVFPIMLFFNFIPDNNRNPNEVSNFIKNDNGSKSIIISPPYYDLTFLYHYNLEIFKNYQRKEINMNLQDISTAYSSNELSFTSLQNKVYYIDMDTKFTLGNNKIFDSLNRLYKLKEQISFKGNVVVSKFEK